MALNLFEQFGITDIIGLYNTYLNNKQLKNDINNKEVVDILLKCTQAILNKLIEQDEHLYGNVVKSENNAILKGETLDMKAIQIVVEHMQDTLDEANEYYRDYVVFKDDVPRVAQTSLEMAKTHLTLYMRWHDIVVQLINDTKTSGKEIPDTMFDIWNYKHQKLTDEYNELKYKIDNAR